MDYNFHFEVVWQNSGLLMKGALVTVILSIITIITSTIIGIIFGILRTMGKSKVENKNFLGRAVWILKRVSYWFSTVYVEIIRGVPLLVQIIFVYYAFPELLKGFLGFIGIYVDNINISAFVAAIIALTVCYGAYGAEIVRSGIESIDNGQIEASRSLGLNYFKTLLYVILPQAIKRIIPPLTSQFAALIKDTSLVSVITISELTLTAQNITTRSFRYFEILVATGVIYFVMTFVVSMISKYFERRSGQ